MLGLSSVIILSDLDKSIPLLLSQTLLVLNSLVDDGFIETYVIGGSLAIMYYSEPFNTKDLDVFVYLPGRPLFVDLGPIWKHLESLGCMPRGLGVVIKGVPVEFISPGPENQLEMEAMDSAVSIEVSGVPSRIFQLEYSMAIKVGAGRNKDWGHIFTALDSAEPDLQKLESILERFGLLEKWKRRVHGQ